MSGITPPTLANMGGRNPPNKLTLSTPYLGLFVTRLKRKTKNPERQHVCDPAENDPLESMLFLFHVAFFKKVPVKAQESHVALSKSDLNARKNLSVQY